MSDNINKNESCEVSLNDIKEKLENKITKKQKLNILKNFFLNLVSPIIMLLYCTLLYIGEKNIALMEFFTGEKVVTFFIVIIGIIFLEMGYKKENKNILLNSIEIIVFGQCNICLIYTLSLYPSKFVKLVQYFGLGIIMYYFVKIIILLIKDIKKYKKENNDIKEIIKK